MRFEKWAPFAVVALGACDILDPTEPGYLVPPTVAEDSSLPAIEMNGSRFHIQTFGDPANPVIIFLHGGPGGDHRSLLRMGERHDGYSLADEYFLVYWDQRGAGLSARHDKDVLILSCTGIPSISRARSRPCSGALRTRSTAASTLAWTSLGHWVPIVQDGSRLSSSASTRRSSRT